MRTTTETYWANIFVGFKNTKTGKMHSLEEVRDICSEYVNRAGLCVTVTPTEYIYSDSGNAEEYHGEAGAIIGMINYPRFPSFPESIQHKSLKLAEILKDKLEQHRVTVQFPDETVMLGEHN